MTDYRAEENETDRLSDELKRDEAAALKTCRAVSEDVESLGKIETPDAGILDWFRVYELLGTAKKRD